VQKDNGKNDSDYWRIEWLRPSDCRSAFKLDVTDQGSVESAIAQLLEKSNNQLDVVVNNAGMASAGISEAFTPEQARELFEVNVFGVQRIIRATLPALRAKRAGLVINVGSILGRITLPFFGLYGASKYAVEAISDSYRYELSQLGVDVVLVQPSAYPTNMYAAAQRPANRELAQSYGEVAEIPGRILKTLSASFKARMLRTHKTSPQQSRKSCPHLRVAVRIAS